jgi:sigma-B regulation protein RsbU (phosphoserine phosphatase)
LGGLSVDRRFLAMTFAVYDSRDRSLVLAGSGLPHPLLMRSGRIEEIEIEGVPLGILGPQSYRQLRLELEPGDVLVIYSDGVEDCQAPDEEEFGIERVRQAVTAGGDSADVIAERLMEATERHAGGAEAYDDRTILVLKAVAVDPA